MLNNIFGYFVVRDDDPEDVCLKRAAYASWFSMSIPEEELSKADRIFAHFSGAIHSIGGVLKRDYLSLTMDTFLHAYVLKNKIIVDGVPPVPFDDPLQLGQLVDKTKAIMLEEFDGLMARGSYDVDEFPVQANIFFEEMKAQRLMELFMESSQMLDSVRAKKMIGASDAVDFVIEKSSRIAYVYNREKLQELHGMKTPEKSSFQFVMDFDLPTIDNDTKGLYTTQLFDLEAGPGVGKTRFLVGKVIYRAAVVFKRNVLLFALEQQEEEIKAMLISHHLFQLYGVRIPDSMILKELITDAEQLKMVDAARYDLFESGNHGTVHIKSGPLYINDMTPTIRVLDSLYGPFQLICIDYMYMLRYRYTLELGRLDRTETIRLGYQYLKEFLGQSKKAGFVINQLNREGVEAAKADKDLDETMAAGGMEVFRSTDYNMGISQSAAMEAQRKVRVQNIKKRGTLGAGSILLNAAKDVCEYQEVGGTL